MLKIDNIKIERFEYSGRWVDVITFEDTYEAWITEKNEGVSELLFGTSKHQPSGETVTFEDFKSQVAAYIDMYY